MAAELASTGNRQLVLATTTCNRGIHLSRQGMPMASLVFTSDDEIVIAAKHASFELVH